MTDLETPNLSNLAVIRVAQAVIPYQSRKIMKNQTTFPEIGVYTIEESGKGWRIPSDAGMKTRA